MPSNTIEHDEYMKLMKYYRRFINSTCSIPALEGLQFQYVPRTHQLRLCVVTDEGDELWTSHVIHYLPNISALLNNLRTGYGEFIGEFNCTVRYREYTTKYIEV